MTRGSQAEEWRALATAAAVATVGVLPVFLTGSLAVQMGDDLGFDAAGLGLTVAAFFGAGAASSATAGRLAERLGPASAMRLSAGLSAVTLVGVGTLAWSSGGLFAWLILGGVGNAVAQPATNLYLARTVPPEGLGLAFGVKQSAIPAATLLGGLAVPAVALTLGWRWAFVGAGALGAALAVLHPARALGPALPRGARRSEDDAALRPLLLLAVGVGLGAAAAGTLGSFLVSAGVDSGLSEAGAGLLSSACSAAGIGVRLTAGVRADRRGGRHLAAVVTMLLIGSVGYLGLATEEPGFLIPGAVLAYCLGWSWPGLFNLAIVRNNPGAPGAATGITQTGTYVGALFGPLLFGIVVDRWSYGVAWLCAGAVSLLAAGAIAAGRRLLVADAARRRARAA